MAATCSSQPDVIIRGAEIFDRVFVGAGVRCGVEHKYIRPKTTGQIVITKPTHQRVSTGTADKNVIACSAV